jgi:hypothetical protein
MKKVKVLAKDVVVGDILYVSGEHMNEYNEHLLGDELSCFLTGADTIIIVDDRADVNEFLINGGLFFNYGSDDDVFEKIGHYSKLIRH